MDSFKKYYDNLNYNQKKAVDTIDGPLLVLAGPGTGKTELLSVRAANIIRRHKAKPENILILTYTNAAAKAMKERLVKMLGPDGYDIETGTFHSFANSIILESEEAANYIQDKIQIEDMEQAKLLEYILDYTEGIDAIRPFRAPYFYRRDILNALSELKKDGITPQDFEKYIARLKPDGIYIEDKHIPRLKALAVVYKLYEEYKAGKNKDLFDERGRYDFDDMIIYALEALKNEKGLKNTLQQQYTYIMVDEYQDTNGAQMNLLFELINPTSTNICCVGDDDQSIYRFQGASVGNFKVFKDAFPKAEVVSLKDNYRSTKDIINLSDMIIRHLPDGERAAVKELIPQKDYKQKSVEFHEFSTETEELLFIIDKVEELKDIIENAKELLPEERKAPYNNIAVLVRKREDILKVADAFLKAGIPYATDKETDISSEKRVRQMIDVLSLACMEKTTDLAAKDAVFFRVITSDYFRIPMEDTLRLILHVNSKKQSQRQKGEPAGVTLFSEFKVIFEIKDKEKQPTKKETAALDITKEKFKNPHIMHYASWVIARLLEDAQTRPVHDILMRYIKDAGVFKHILREYAGNNILRTRDLRALSSFVNMVKNSDLKKPGMRLSDFIDEIKTREEHAIALTGNLVTESQEGVRIFTAHGSKGLEFHTVIIPFCLQNKNWPIRPRPDLIPLPPEIFKTKEKLADKDSIRKLNFYDETRLFYVASTRAKSNLIYTSSPTESSISSSYLANIGLSSAESESQVKEEPLLVKSLELTDKEDPFIGTEAVFRDMLANITLNPTSLNNYINCKRKFLYDNVLMLPSEKKTSLIFGSCVHKALEEAYRYLIEYNKFPNFENFKESFERELAHQGVEKSIESRCREQLATLRGWFEKESREPIRPLGLEKKLTAMIDDKLIFTGMYDKTELVDKNKKLVRVIDYKTGKPDEHIKRIDAGTRDLSSNECDGYLRQLVAYKLLFDRDKARNNGFKVESGILVFVEPVKEDSPKKYGLKKGEFVKKSIEITEDMVLELERVIRGSWASIMNLDFKKLPKKDEGSGKCGGCDYNNICWG